MTRRNRAAKADLLSTVAAQRLDLADFFDTVHDTDWTVDSACPGWTVHDVLAHLTLSTRQPFVATSLRLIRTRGDFNRVVSEMACERSAQFTPAELTAQLRATADSSRRMPGSSPFDPLIDLLVHGQDVARPLGRDRDPAPELVARVLDPAWSAPFYGAPKRFAGLRFTATDIDWSRGDGELVVHGPAIDLLLLATGRPAGLDRVTGPGLSTAAERLVASR